MKDEKGESKIKKMRHEEKQSADIWAQTAFIQQRNG